VQALGVALADAVGIATTARGFRQATLDHVFDGLEELPDELFLPTHQILLSYTYLKSQSREK
jgi:hypothetical protein